MAGGDGLRARPGPKTGVSPAIPLLFFCNRVRGGVLQNPGRGYCKAPFHQVPHSSVLIPEYSVPTVTNGNNGRGRERPPP